MNRKYNKNIFLSLGVSFMLMIAPVAFAQSDTEPPTDVENVKAVADDSSVKLSWNVAKDNDVVSGYKIYYGKTSVTEAGQKYDDIIDAGNKITYTVENLKNDTTYYFAVTAYDTSGNESDNYSVEVSATPTSNVDNESPTVVKAESLDKYTVLVSFNEAVKLPKTDSKSAFNIMNDKTSISLDVLAVAMNLQDTTGKTVLLTTASQELDANYVLTAGILITDLAGNPIKSGTSDTALFVGSDQEPKALDSSENLSPSADDKTAPSLIDVKIPDNTHVKVAFSEIVVLGPTPTLSFIITEESNSNNFLKVVSVDLSDEGDVVTLTTSPQKAINYNLIVMEDVTDEAGNMIDVENNATVFLGVSGDEDKVDDDEKDEDDSPLGDVTPPEDVTNFNAKLIEDMIALLSWKPSIDSMGDLANYVLYKSTDGVTFDDGLVLDPTDKEYRAKGLLSDVTYFFKLTAKDKSGNESDGVTAAFKMELPKTGPGLAFLLLGSAGIGKLVSGRKKKRK